MGAWIETPLNVYNTRTECSRILHGCVDWNVNTLLMNTKSIVASYMGAWIETYVCKSDYQKFLVASYMGAWIETW